ncbi:hypothetical protein [Peptoanaerobacter stomatis]
MIDERTLPRYLKNDIEAFKKAIEEKNELLSKDLWCELYGSINSAMWGYEISEEVAAYLRDKYLGI